MAKTQKAQTQKAQAQAQDLAQAIAGAIAQAIAGAIAQALAPIAPAPESAPVTTKSQKSQKAQKSAPESAPAPEPKKSAPRGRKKAERDMGAVILEVAKDLASVDRYKRGMFRLAQILENRINKLGPDLGAKYLAEVARLLQDSPRQAVDFAIMGTKDLRAKLGGGE